MAQRAVAIDKQLRLERAGVAHLAANHAPRRLEDGAPAGHAEPELRVQRVQHPAAGHERDGCNPMSTARRCPSRMHNHDRDGPLRVLVHVRRVNGSVPREIVHRKVVQRLLQLRRVVQRLEDLQGARCFAHVLREGGELNERAR